MNLKKKILVVIVLAIQIVLIIILIVIIISRKTIGSTFSINPIKQDTINFNSKSRWKYYYEPKANTTEKETADWLGYEAYYTINADTLNERYTYSVPKPQDVYRIITLGDSFTFGQFVDTKNNYPELLEDLLNENIKCNNISKFDVINLGVKGYDVYYEIERYRVRGAKYNPDLVLWFISEGNFLQDNEYMLKAVKQFRNPVSIDVNKFEIKGSYYTNWEQARLELIEQTGVEALLTKVTDSLNDFRKMHDGPVVLFGFTSKPEYKKIFHDFVASNKNAKYHEALVNIYELDGALPDQHPNEKGYKLIAQDVFSYLTKNNIISCN